MKRRYLKGAIAGAAVLALGLGGVSLARASSEPKPVCEHVAVQENSGNGPNYPMRLCGPSALPVKSIVIDGSALPEKSESAWAPVGIWGGTAVPATTVNSLPDLAGCFGHHGVQLSTHIAFECIDQSVSGGALYWSANESNFNWDKHPAQGLDWVEASTLHPTPDSNPPNNRQAFWVGIAHNGTFCTVVNPGYDQHPTQCEENGVVHTMTTKQQASYDAFAAAMTAANIPDCAWSMTITSDQCDVDS